MALLFVAAAAHAQTPTVKKTDPAKMVIPKLPGPTPEPLLCDQLHLGKFKTISGGKNVFITRTSTTETDQLEGDGNPTVYKIKWKGQCEFVLTPTPETFRKHPEIPRGAVLTVNIYSRNTDSWTETFTTNYSKGMVNVDIYKIK